MTDSMAEPWVSHWVSQRIRAALMRGWFTSQALRYCRKDYGSERLNQYRFYRTVYGMTASQALAEVNKFRAAMEEIR